MKWNEKKNLKKSDYWKYTKVKDECNNTEHRGARCVDESEARVEVHERNRNPYN